MSAILLLVVGAAIYMGFRKFPQARDTVEIETTSSGNYFLDTLTYSHLQGKTLYYSKCVVCHGEFKMKDGPWLSLIGVDSKWPDRKELVAYIQNPEKVRKTNVYAQELKKSWGDIAKPSFPELSESEILSIIDYILWEKRDRSVLK